MMAAQSILTPVVLSDLLSGLVELSTALDRPVDSLTLDSRSLQPGGLFLACRGGSHHGLAFLSQAIDRGAAAVVAEPDEHWTPEVIRGLGESALVPVISLPGLGRLISLIAGRFYGEPSEGMSVVGFTGTNGKTSCTQFLAQAMAPDVRCGIIGTLGCGFPGALDIGIHTTPDPVTLQSMLARLRDGGAAAVAMEVSSHALEQGRAAAVDFDTAVLTNLSRDHLDYHGSMAEYAASKRRLFQSPGLGCVVVNLDDPFGRELIVELPTTLNRIGYGLENRVQSFPGVDRWIQADGIDSSESGMRIRVRGSWGEGELKTPLLGHFNVSNLLAVLSVLLNHGLPLRQALMRLSKLQTVSGRMERFGGATQPLVVVDYAHTPDALKHVLTALRDHTSGRLICLFGCGGERDRGKRPQMGAIAELIADRVFVTDDNPRREDGAQIRREILEGMKRPAQAVVVPDRAQAIREAVAAAGPGDLVLIAGKGHETTQQVGDIKLPFSDREQVVEALAEGRR